MLTIFVLLGLPLFSTVFTVANRSARNNHRVTLAMAVAHVGASFHLLVSCENPFPVEGWFAADPLARFFLIILSHTFLLVVLYSPGFLRRMEGVEHHQSRRPYYPALNFYLLANTMVIITQHFGLLWVVMEMTTFSLSPLVYFYRSKESLEAVWKYLFLVSLGMMFLLMGILFLGVAARGLSGPHELVMAKLIAQASNLDPLWVKVSFVLVVVGVSAKIGLAPMHPADIDATSNAPAPVAALMAGCFRSTAVLVLLRFYAIVFQTDARPFAQRLMLTAGVLSLGVASVYIWRNRNYKRLLAYSSVEHMGIIVLAIGVGGVAMLGALLHVMFNSLGKIALFFMAGNIHHEFQTREVDPIQGLMQRIPWSGFLWGMAFFYIVGTPPFGIFFSELRMLQGMIEHRQWLVLSIFLTLLMIIFIGMGRTVLRMLQTPSLTTPERSVVAGRFKLSHALGLYALLISVPIALFQPAFLFDTLGMILSGFGFSP